jgi:hypothetical protein
MPIISNVSQVPGDDSGFCLQQSRRLLNIGIDIDGLTISHLAFRTETFAGSAATYAQLFTGQQDQGPLFQPYFVTYANNTDVKVLQHSLHDVCVLEGIRFDGFYHVIGLSRMSVGADPPNSSLEPFPRSARLCRCAAHFLTVCQANAERAG